MQYEQSMMSQFPVDALRNALMNIDSNVPYIFRGSDEEDKELIDKLEKVSEKVIEDNL